VDGGGGLPDTTFLVRDSDDHWGCWDCNRRSGDYYILYLPRSSGSRLSSHLWRRSASGLSAATSNGLALSMTVSSTKIGARVRSASAIASLGRASIVTVSPFSAR